MKTKSKVLIGVILSITAIFVFGYFEREKNETKSPGGGSDSWNESQSTIPITSGIIDGSLVRKDIVTASIGVDGVQIEHESEVIEQNDADNPVNSPENPKNQLDD
tara:strand:+ start:82 stop:396 length:315 start_codon:yes stop_codon:yes gene_type:complete